MARHLWCTGFLFFLLQFHDFGLRAVRRGEAGIFFSGFECTQFFNIPDLPLLWFVFLQCFVGLSSLGVFVVLSSFVLSHFLRFESE